MLVRYGPASGIPFKSSQLKKVRVELDPLWQSFLDQGMFQTMSNKSSFANNANLRILRIYFSVLIILCSFFQRSVGFTASIACYNLKKKKLINKNTWQVPSFLIFRNIFLSLWYNWAVTWDFQQCGMCDQQRLRPACTCAQSDQSHCKPLENYMTVKLLTEHHLEFLSLTGGRTGSSESIHVKMPHCWKSHVTAQFM